MSSSLGEWSFSPFQRIFAISSQLMAGWVIARDARSELTPILEISCRAVRDLSVFLSPLMPWFYLLLIERKVLKRHANFLP